MSFAAPDASAIEDSNALALAIVPSELGNANLLLFFSTVLPTCASTIFVAFYVHQEYPFPLGASTPTFNSQSGQPKDFDPTGWELALVTTPSTDISAANDRKLVWPSCGIIMSLSICSSGCNLEYFAFFSLKIFINSFFL